MKIYTPAPPLTLIRLQIRKQKEQTYYLTLCKTDMNKVIDFCKKIIIQQGVDPFANGTKTSIHIRKAVGSKNLESKSISFIGLSTGDTYNLINEAIKKIQL